MIGLFCTNCGQKLPNDAVFCSRCGARVQSATAASPGKRQGHWEYKEFTHRFDEPITVNADAAGGSILVSRVRSAARELGFKLKREGWELTESIEGAELVENGRVDIEVKEYGLVRKKALIKAKSVTVKFRRWVE